MYICLECNTLFNIPVKHTETHGLDIPPYETWYGCPKCAGNYAEAQECDLCGKWITGEYIKLKDGTLVCDQCYEVRDITD